MFKIEQISFFQISKIQADKQNQSDKQAQLIIKDEGTREMKKVGKIQLKLHIIILYLEKLNRISIDMILILLCRKQLIFTIAAVKVGRKWDR
jgi:hypothetical protein